MTRPPAASGADAPDSAAGQATTVATASTASGQAGAAAAGSDRPPPKTGKAKQAEQHHGAGSGGLLLAALGIVFGDIGTSPLYALQTVFAIDGGIVRPTQADVYGVISMMFWSITLIVSIKYISVLMRADNNGEGGVMALTALARRLYASRGSRATSLVILGILGVSLFYGDSLITPAISVLSAVEGVRVAAPGLGHVVVPVAGVILTVLFAVQRFGTGKVGALFGPVMLLWFGALAAAGDRRHRGRTPACWWGCHRPTPCPSSSAIPSSRSSRWARSCWSSPGPRRSTPTWATSAGRRSAAPGSSWSSRRWSSTTWVRPR